MVKFLVVFYNIFPKRIFFIFTSSTFAWSLPNLFSRCVRLTHSIHGVRVVHRITLLSLSCLTDEFSAEVFASFLLSPPVEVETVQFSPLSDWVVGEHEERFSRDPVPVFSAESPCERFLLALPTVASPTLQGALKDGFGEAVVPCAK